MIFISKFYSIILGIEMNFKLDVTMALSLEHNDITMFRKF